MFSASSEKFCAFPSRAAAIFGRDVSSDDAAFTDSLVVYALILEIEERTTYTIAEATTGGLS